MKSSAMFSDAVPNIATYTTDVVFHLYSASGGTGILVYHDNGTAGTDAKIYVPWDTTGASDINIGHSTQASPIENYPSLSAGTYYIGAWWLTHSSRIDFEISSSPWSAQVLRGPLTDYNALTNTAAGPELFFSTNSSSAVTLGSGGTVSVVGNGGVNWMVNQT